MNWQEYAAYFDGVLKNETRSAPYDDEHFFEYTRLNAARQNRWLKQDILTENTKQVLSQIKEPQVWELITEPWCGDAAHIVPVVYKMSMESALVKLNIQLRDSNSEIDKYLTNGTKSIPILIIRNSEGKDLAVWGPRPKLLSEIFTALKSKNLPLEELKIVLQNWYNTDKSMEVQKEIIATITSIGSSQKT